MLRLNWKREIRLDNPRYKAHAGAIVLEVAPEDLRPEFWCGYVLGEMTSGRSSAQEAQEWAEGTLESLLSESLTALGIK